MDVSLHFEELKLQCGDPAAACSETRAHVVMTPCSIYRWVNITSCTLWIVSADMASMQFSIIALSAVIVVACRRPSEDCMQLLATRGQHFEDTVLRLLADHLMSPASCLPRSHKQPAWHLSRTDCKTYSATLSVGPPVKGVQFRIIPGAVRNVTCRHLKASR